MLAHVKDTIVNSLLKLKNIKDAKKQILESCKSIELSSPKILILNTPCHGFGDIIFAIKLAKYLRKWYNADVKIATTKVKQFISIGESKENLYELKGSSKAEDCRRFKNLKFEQKIPKFDLLFVAPLQADFDISKNDVKSLIDYSDEFNTYFFSEYNDVSRKKFDFPTGVGGKRLGLFFTDVDITEHLENPNIKNPYAVCYIAETIVRSTQCYLSFFNMICKKYIKKYKNFDIVCPTWIVKDLSENKKNLIPLLKYYSKIILNTKDSKEEIINKSVNNDFVLSIRGDILPVPNKDMISLMIHSVDDILLTGDQSITDALSCCYRKNIWYQIAPWKQNFGKELAKHLPQKYFKKKKTSCGTIYGINFKSNFEKFVKKWDFRILAREKMDNVVKFSSIKEKKEILKILDIVKSSKTLKSLKNKL